MIWREKQWLLIGLAVFLVANLAFFFTYRVRYQDRVESLQATLEQREAQLAETKHRQARARATVSALAQMEKDIATVYEEWWSTPQRRLTDLLVELKTLEAKSRLSPRSTAYAMTESTKKAFGNTEMGITFSVQGSYGQIRQLINLLELSPHFVVIDQVTIGGGGEGDQLNLSLQLKTIFHQPPEEGQNPPSGAVAENRL